jgi:hypothetical protein
VKHAIVEFLARLTGLPLTHERAEAEARRRVDERLKRAISETVVSQTIGYARVRKERRQP